MASRLFTSRPLLLFSLASTTGLLLAPAPGFSIIQPWRRPLYCDTFTSSSGSTPLFKSGPGSKGGLNPAAVRQISTGSVLGLVSGLGISMFSKSLAVVLGVVILAVQFVEGRLGIRIVPRERIQRWITDVDYRRFVEGNMPFKVSYGAALLLAGWGRFSSI